MKSNLLFCLIFFYFSTSFSQTGIIKYSSQMPKDKKSINERTRKIMEEVNRSTFKLKYNNKKSFFSKDHILPLYPLEAKLAAILVGANKDYFQNSSKKESLINVEIKNNLYIVDNTTKMEDWTLESDVKIIDGYTCYKATKKIYYPRTGTTDICTAWYTLDIPVPYGPAGYGGLPGLILQLQLGSKFIYVVNEIKLNSNKNLIIKEIKKGEKISIEGFVKLSRESRNYTKD